MEENNTQAPEEDVELKKMNWAWLIATASILFVLFVIIYLGLKSHYVDPRITDFGLQTRKHAKTYIGDQGAANNLIAKVAKAAQLSGCQNTGTSAWHKLMWLNVEDSRFRKTQHTATSQQKLFLKYGKRWFRKAVMFKENSDLHKTFTDLSCAPIFSLTAPDMPLENWKKDRLPLPDPLPQLDPQDFIYSFKLFYFDLSAQNAREKAHLAGVRIAAKLLKSEHMTSLMLGLKVLTTLLEADEFADDEFGNLSGRDGLIPTELRQTRRALDAGLSYFRTITDYDVLKEVFQLESPQNFGLCAIIQDGLLRELSHRKQLMAQWPLESNFIKQMRHLQDFKSKADSVCEFSILNHILKLDILPDTLAGPAGFNQLPYLRRLFALRSISFSLGGFDAYLEKTAPLE